MLAVSMFMFSSPYLLSVSDWYLANSALVRGFSWAFSAAPSLLPPIICLTLFFRGLYWFLEFLASLSLKFGILLVVDYSALYSVMLLASPEAPQDTTVLFFDGREEVSNVLHNKLENALGANYDDGEELLDGLEDKFDPVDDV